jgi:uncharacterized protein YcbK (DUF882 family)
MAQIASEARILRLERVTSQIVWVLFLLVCVLRLHGRSTVASMDKSKEYRLRLYHTHTNERIDIVYRHGDAYVPGAIDRLNRFLRDHRTGEVHRYNPQVFDLLNDLGMAVGRPGSEIDVICGYRTPWSNEFLRQNSSGVALASAGFRRDFRTVAWHRFHNRGTGL